MEWSLFWTLLVQFSLGALPVIVVLYLLISVVRVGLSNRMIHSEPRYFRGTTVPRYESTTVYSTKSTKSTESTESIK